MQLDSPALAAFVDRQLREFGGNVEVDTGQWALFGVPANDPDGNALAAALLAEVSFPHESGSTEDDAWTLYYVDSATRPDATHWLADLQHQIRGEVRPPSPAQRKQIRELAESTMPHRMAQKLGEEHSAGRLSAGSVNVPQEVRALLDRLHLREPLFYSAFQQLLTHHLLDLKVLLQQIIMEDVELSNELMRGGISRDPFLQSRQDAAADIRRRLVTLCIISPLDQSKNTSMANPYAAFMEIVRVGDKLTLSLDGNNVSTSTTSFRSAVHSTRRELYAGGRFESFDTQVPWMRDEIAHPFRFIKRRLEARRDIGTLDGLYMLERAIE